MPIAAFGSFFFRAAANHQGTLMAEGVDWRGKTPGRAKCLNIAK
jgi:hypothetical protein